MAQGRGPFYFPDGKARFNMATYTPPTEDVDEDCPIILTTGRVVSQYLCGTQTRRIGPLVDQYPEPRVELHPLLAVVSTQSISVTGARIAGSFGAWQELILFITLSMFLLGCMLYLLIISLIFYRFTFFKLTPEGLAPPYWINMGAMAITTLAGATLILDVPSWTFVQEILPFLKGLTLFFWVTATWWIPLLFVLGIWRHGLKQFPFVYDPAYWGMVFPLGMYTAATFQLAKALGFPFLLVISQYFVYVALAAWLIIFVGLLRRLGQGLKGARLAPTSVSL